jgi:hypothetical protein
LPIIIIIVFIVYVNVCILIGNWKEQKNFHTLNELNTQRGGTMEKNEKYRMNKLTIMGKECSHITNICASMRISRRNVLSSYAYLKQLESEFNIQGTCSNISTFFLFSTFLLRFLFFSSIFSPYYYIIFISGNERTAVQATITKQFLWRGKKLQTDTINKIIALLHRFYVTLIVIFLLLFFVQFFYNKSQCNCIAMDVCFDCYWLRYVKSYERMCNEGSLLAILKQFSFHIRNEMKRHWGNAMSLTLGLFFLLLTSYWCWCCCCCGDEKWWVSKVRNELTIYMFVFFSLRRKRSLLILQCFFSYK